MDLKKILDRVDKDGIAFTDSNRNLKNISKKSDAIVFGNRRLGKSVIIDKKKLQKLLGNDFL